MQKLGSYVYVRVQYSTKLLKSEHTLPAAAACCLQAMRPCGPPEAQVWRSKTGAALQAERSRHVGVGAARGWTGVVRRLECSSPRLARPGRRPAFEDTLALMSHALARQVRSGILLGQNLGP